MAADKGKYGTDCTNCPSNLMGDCYEDDCPINYRAQDRGMTAAEIQALLDGEVYKNIGSGKKIRDLARTALADKKRIAEFEAQKEDLWSQRRDIGRFRIKIEADHAQLRDRIAELEGDKADLMTALKEPNDPVLKLAFTRGNVQQEHIAKLEADKLEQAERECHYTKRIAELEAMLRLDSTWPLLDIARRLSDATRHLLDVHDCDVDGWEIWKAAVDALANMEET